MFVLAAVWAGLLSGSTLPFDVPFLLALAGAVTGALTLSPGRTRVVPVLAACFFFLGALRSPEVNAIGPGRAGAGPLRSDRFPVVLRVRLPFLKGQCEENVRARVEEVFVGDRRLLGGCVIIRGFDLDARGGQRTMIISGTFYAPQPPRNPMAYDAAGRSRWEGVVGSVRVGEVTGETCALPDRALARMRHVVRGLIATVPDTGARGVLEATLLGARGGLSPEVRSTMVRAGTYHVLAISGLHVGILVFMISMLGTVMRLNRAGRVAVTLALVAFYIVFTGARPSAMRAGAFYLIVSIARLLQYKVDYPNAVCCAGAGLLVAAPGLAWDLGFRLSFGAVFGMTLFLPEIAVAVPGRSPVVVRVRAFVEAGLLAAFSAQVLTLPLILWSFGRVSVIAGISNLAVLPLMSLALTAGIEGALIGGFIPGLGSVFMRSAAVLVGAAVRLAEALGGCVNPLVYPGRPHAAQVAAYYAVVLWLGLFERRLGRGPRVALLGAAFALMLVRIPGSPGRAGDLEITFLYVGNGDACVMELPGGETVLIDTGPASADYDAAERVVLPFLALRGIGSVDRLIITHSHNDHYGGIPALLRNIEVGEILVSTTEGEAPYMAALDTARRTGVPVRCVRAGDAWNSGGVRFEVLHPGGAGGPGVDMSQVEVGREDPNAWSLVIKATLGEHSVLLTGDLTPAMQESLVARGVDLECDVLKVPHHGHPGETSAAFASAVGADLAVISCGAKYFDAPDSSTMVLLENAGMKALSTRIDGAVRVRTDGRRLSVSKVLGTAENASH